MVNKIPAKALKGITHKLTKMDWGVSYEIMHDVLRRFFKWYCCLSGPPFILMNFPVFIVLMFYINIRELVIYS
jgi:hypothetical protein